MRAHRFPASGIHPTDPSRCFLSLIARQMRLGMLRLAWLAVVLLWCRVGLAGSSPLHRLRSPVVQSDAASAVVSAPTTPSLPASYLPATDLTTSEWINQAFVAPAPDAMPSECKYTETYCQNGGFINSTGGDCAPWYMGVSAGVSVGTHFPIRNLTSFC
jgi:hypothetical protein